MTKNRSEAFTRYNHSAAGRAAQRRYKRRHRMQLRKRNRAAYYSKRYNLTEEQAVKLRGRSCEICSKTSQRMVIDHKELGSYRGILCDACNGKLGWYEKRRERILNYLDKA